MTESNETTDRADLSWLADVTPVKTTMRTSRRGRQPGKNPVAGHVKNAHDSGETISLPVPAQHARQTERTLRRAALRENWSISVQVLNEHPDTATSENVIALKDLSALPDGSDVWISFSVTDKEDGSADGTDAGEPAETPDANADPFAGQPETPETAPEAADDKPRKGRRSGRAA